MNLNKIKVVLLAGGLGTRISEETSLKPKPMVKIGSKPILWHIMKIYDFHGIKNFIIAGGYKIDFIKKFFKKNSAIIPRDWNIKIVNTGLKTMTGGRIKKLYPLLKNDNFFLATYGDAVARINIKKLIKFHLKKNKIATLTAVTPPERFGKLKIIKNNIIIKFQEKPKNILHHINGGFFCFNKKIFKFIKDSDTVLEREPLAKLANMRQLVAFKLKKYWQPMDTLYEKKILNNLWRSGKAPWKIW